MMMEIDIVSGFLGAGKTTFLNKIIPHLKGKIVLIENEFGKAGVDGDLLSGGLPVKELSSGCICCGLTTSFQSALSEIARTYAPDRVLVEPSGVGQLSDVVAACEGARADVGRAVPGADLSVGRRVAIVDASSYLDYSQHFGSFYMDQVRGAGLILFSHMDDVDVEGGVEAVIRAVQSEAPHALLYEKDWSGSDGWELAELFESIRPGAHEDRDAHERHEHHHDHDHEHGHEHEDLHGLMSSCSVVDPPAVGHEKLGEMLEALKAGRCGQVFRGKGILRLTSGETVRFDFTPKHQDWEEAAPDLAPRAVFIGRELDEGRIRGLFASGGAEARGA